MQLQIRTMSNVHPDFYRLIGPLMGSREVEREVGIRLYDDDDKEWYTTWIDGAFVGVASVRGSVISDYYVKPHFRCRGALTAMVQSIIMNYPGKLRATCTKLSAGVFAEAGFKLVNQTKKELRHA